MPRLLMTIGLAGTSIGLWVPTAGADCVGPGITFTPHDVGRGEAVAVSGTGWGDNCYDTGPPPDGEGVLGRPIDEITVVLVQDDREWELWAGPANADYEFSAAVSVPPDASPGVATLTARRDDSPTGWEVTTHNPDSELRISDERPISTTSTSAGPTPTFSNSSASTPSTGDHDDSSAVAAAAGAIRAIGIVVVICAAAALVLRRRRR